MQPILKTRSLRDELAGGDGSAFEEFMKALIQSESELHGIFEKDIEFDYRTNVGDHGIDLEIKKSHGNPNPRFVPATQSIWSFKSGEDGAEVARFEKEVTKPEHQPLRDRLTAGFTFVWTTIHPAQVEKRATFVAKAAQLATANGWQASQFEFRWDNHIHDLSERWTNVLAAHIPKAWAKVSALKRISSWEPSGADRVGYNAPWVALVGRESLPKVITDHLNGSTGTAVLHIAGLSGIGKTRLVFEACKASGLEDTFYLPGYESWTDELIDYLREPGRQTRLVVDEVQLTHVNDVFGKLAGAGDQVRIVTIGPATRRDSRTTNTRQVINLAEPDSATDTFEVVRSFAQEVHEDVARFVALKARHDLRFAILLASAVREVGASPDLVPRRPDEIWDRILRLFRNVPRVETLKDVYRFLTVAIDVGRSENTEAELKYLSEHFAAPVVALRDCIEVANEVGLGVTSPNYFEACPRGLASFIFEEQALHQLLPKMLEFLKNCPPRLARRVVERCQEVQDDARREEVEERIAAYFRHTLGAPNVLSIAERDASRLFARWAELDPHRGLHWLSDAILNATDSVLAQFDGEPDGSGGWRGRRQVVWLLEFAACFAEFFATSEEMLFRLAQVETEPSIGNNSRGIWKSMFSVVLSNTEVAFGERWAILMNRLKVADERTFDLIAGAAQHALMPPPPMRQAPPAIVGGRIVPKAWLPKDWSHAQELQSLAAGQLLEVLPAIDASVLPAVRTFLIRNAGLFARHRQAEAFKKVADALIAETSDVRHLRNSIENVVRTELARPKDKARSHWKQTIAFLENWLQVTAPSTLQDEIKALTSQAYWSPARTVSTKDHGELAIPYAALARKIVVNLGVLDDLATWLDSPECVSGQQLGEQLGMEDAQHAAVSTILKWLEGMVALPFAIGYVRKQDHTDETRTRIADLLDELAMRDPENAFYLSVFVDSSDRGIERVVGLLEIPEVAGLQHVALLAFEPWSKVLNKQQQAHILELLLKHVDAGAVALLATVARLCVFWSSKGAQTYSTDLLPQIMHYLKLEYASAPVASTHEWNELVGLAMKSHPSELAEVLIGYATALKNRSYERSDFAQMRLVELAAEAPKEVAVAVVEAMRHPEQRQGFYFLNLGKLFAAIDFNVLKPLIENGDELLLGAVARHLPSPYLDGDGKPVVPEPTEWVLTRPKSGGRVLKEFLAGRHSGQWMSSGAAAKRSAALRRLLAEFEKRPEKWIQQWIQYERAELESDRRSEEEIDEKLDRE